MHIECIRRIVTNIPDNPPSFPAHIHECAIVQSPGIDRHDFLRCFFDFFQLSENSVFKFKVQVFVRHVFERLL